MGNDWEYAVVLRELPADRSDIVTRVFGMSQSLGYALIEKPYVCDNKGDDHPFTSRAECYEYLATHGGSVAVFDGQEPDGNDLRLDFDWKRKQVVTGSLSDFARRHDGVMAADLKAMFVFLCKDLRPFYGYSSDEWMVEAAFANKKYMSQWRAFERAVRKERVPPLLFWLNYFDSGYFERIGEARMGEVPHCIVPLEDRGIFVSLSEYPWEGKLAVLGDDDRYEIVSRLDY